MTCKHFQTVGPGQHLATTPAHAIHLNCPWCEIEQLRGTLSLAEEGLANYAQDHKQYVDWATPQLERLGREMVENERLRKQLSARLQELERIKRKRLDWAMLCDHDCPACTELDDAIRGDVPQSAPHAAEQDAK